MPIRFWLMATILFFTATTAHANPQAKQDSPKIAKPANDARKLFARYPQSDAFEDVVRRHLDSKWQRQFGFLVYATQFQGNPTVANIYYVKETGNARKERDVYNWAIQAGQDWKLSRARLADIRSALTKLPPSDPPASLKDLFIVTYLVGGKRATRIYDATKLPGPFAHIMQSKPQTPLPIMASPIA